MKTTKQNEKLKTKNSPHLSNSLTSFLIPSNSPLTLSNSITSFLFSSLQILSFLSISFRWLLSISTSLYSVTPTPTVETNFINLHNLRIISKDAISASLPFRNTSKIKVERITRASKRCTEFLKGRERRGKFFEG